MKFFDSYCLIKSKPHKGGQAFEEAMANQTKDDIFEMLGMVFKEKFVKFIETAIELQEIVLTDDALNIDALLEAIFHPQVHFSLKTKTLVLSPKLDD